MGPRKAVPTDLASVQTKRLARQLTAANDAILAAVEQFVHRPETMSPAALSHVKGWCADAARDARRLDQVLATKAVS